ncbi:hypothetical protein H0H81_002811 [Sphagnurus paluster]|uniref:Uncharacterized protein n=1 Tax=Sphagnurus paluster TaxID=117069 RepID=A0A9P7GMX5_9AGAR|nr:hypothetical protein H0H81_002811 [Sphagnurus paluster]
MNTSRQPFDSSFTAPISHFSDADAHLFTATTNHNLARSQLFSQEQSHNASNLYALLSNDLYPSYVQQQHYRGGYSDAELAANRMPLFESVPQHSIQAGINWGGGKVPGHSFAF